MASNSVDKVRGSKEKGSPEPSLGGKPAFPANLESLAEVLLVDVLRWALPKEVLPCCLSATDRWSGLIFTMILSAEVDRLSSLDGSSLVGESAPRPKPVPVKPILLLLAMLTDRILALIASSILLNLLLSTGLLSSVRGRVPLSSNITEVVLLTVF